MTFDNANKKDAACIENLFSSLLAIETANESLSLYSVRGSLLETAKKMLLTISLAEFKANPLLRQKTRDLIREIFTIEAYLEDRARYDQSTEH